jgi:hypothetical protein
MTDTPDITPSTDSTPCDWETKRTAYEKLRAELQPRNKTALFDLLAAACITHVVVSFDGCGDSGQIENMEANRADIAADIPAVQIDIMRAVWDKEEPERVRLSVADVIEQLVYDFLEDTHSGWENNDGACGDFTFDVAARTITLNYNERYESYESSQHVF